MKLFGSLVSPYVARVVLSARAKGIDLPLLPLPGSGPKSPEFLAMNPIGKMPVLEDQGRYIVESSVIVEYIDESNPAKPLLPKNPAERAQVRVLARIVDLYVMAQMGMFFRNMNPAQRNQSEVDAGKEGLNKALSDLQHFMSDRGPFCAGANISMADCTLFPALLIMNNILPAFGTTNVLAGLPKLSRWWQHVQLDPLCSAFAREYQVAFKEFMAKNAA